MRVGATKASRAASALSLSRIGTQLHRRLTLGRDCLGNRPLFFYRTGDFVVFASTLKILLALPEVPRELDEIVLANFLAVNLDEPSATFYRGISGCRAAP